MLMSDVPTRYTFDRVVRLTLTVAGVIGLFLLLRYLSDVLLPFVAAAVLAYLINPIVNAFERKLNRRPLAVACSGSRFRKPGRISTSTARYRRPSPHGASA